MIRKKLKEQTESSDFRFRGLDNTRIEALSDGVFAIAIALLLISTSVPEKFSELQTFIGDFIPFAITITLLMIIWQQHYTYFVRYGLKDAKVVALNTVLLILLLYYVYPLKFLFKMLYTLFSALITDNQGKLEYLFTEIIGPEDGNELMIIYGCGAASIFGTLALMYYYAFKQKDRIQLDELELFDTKSSIFNNLYMMFPPVLSIFIAWIRIGGENSFSIAGMSYWTYMVIMPTYSIYRSQKRKAIFLTSNSGDEEIA